MNKIFPFLWVVLCMGSPVISWGNHIYGGNMSLQTTQTPGKYTLSLTFFFDKRNADPTNGYESPIVYLLRKKDNTPVSSLRLSPQQQQDLFSSSAACTSLLPLSILRIRYSAVLSLRVYNPLKAQNPWIHLPFINPTEWHFVPYVPPTGTPATGSFVDVKQKVSESIVLLSYEFSEKVNGIKTKYTGIGTDFLIKTSPEKSHVCMLTAGHFIENMLENLGLPMTTSLISPYTAFNYVRNGQEVSSRQEFDFIVSCPNRSKLS